MGEHIKLITLNFPERREEIIGFVKRHHYSRRCPHVWSVAYAIENANGKICAVTIYGPAPYPTVARAFCRDGSHIKHHVWQARMVGQGISSSDIDQLIYYANNDLRERGFWWVHTLTNPTSSMVEAVINIICKGFTGDVYKRTGALYLGTAGRKALAGFIVDGQPIHKRQGAITLSLSNVSAHYPDADIRPIYSSHKQRWAYVLADTPQEREDRLLLMAYRPQPYQMMRQPRLLIQLIEAYIAMLSLWGGHRAR